MKNKIISIIFIILLITSCRKSQDITGGGGNNGGNNGNSRRTKYNYEPPQKDTKVAKDFLVKLMEMKKQYPKGELMAYYKGLTSWHFTIDSGYKKYYFDSNANITNIYINGSGDTVTNCIFWGMLPDDTRIACYYYKKSDGKIEVLNSLMYENGLIKDKVQFFTGTGIGKDENLERKSREAILKNLTTTNNSTTTTENDNWKNQVAGKII